MLSIGGWQNGPIMCECTGKRDYKQQSAPTGTEAARPLSFLSNIVLIKAYFEATVSSGVNTVTSLQAFHELLCYYRSMCLPFGTTAVSEPH